MAVAQDHKGVGLIGEYPGVPPDDRKKTDAEAPTYPEKHGVMVPQSV